MRGMRLTLQLAAVVAVAFCLSLGAPADVTVTLAPTGSISIQDGAAAVEPAVTVTKSDLSGFLAATGMPEFALRSHTNSTGEFVELGWNEAATLGEIGQPAIPVVRRLFVAPQGAHVSVAYTLGASVVLDRATLGTSLLALPVQPPIEKLPGAREAAVFQFDAEAYEVNADLPAERVTIEELGIIRDQRLFLLEIRPVTYNPVAERVTLYPDITVNVSFDGGAIPRNALSPLPGLGRSILNPEVLPNVTQRGLGNYLIVVASAYQADIQAFAAAKADEGFTVSQYVVPAGTTNSTIKTYIQSLWGTASAPAYILLVGDTNTIPSWTGGGDGNPDTDLNYTCMNGSSDWYPDIAIGRFSCRTSAQLQAIVNKTLYYQANEFADPAYLKRAVFMASEDNYDVSEGTHNYVINTYMIPNGYTVDKLYCHTYNATTAQVTAAFNNGRFFGIYSGHGGSTSWADGPVFSQSNVTSLTNVNMYPFICSFACITGDYDAYDECFIETWSRAANKAAVTAWGSSVNSYWTEDDILEKRLFDVIFDADPNAVVKEVGPVFNETRVRYLAHFGATSTTRRYFEMYNLFGDPSVWLIQLPEPPTGMKVTPKDDLIATGNYGDPVNPASAEYTLENKNETPMSYEVTVDVPWVDIVNGAGTIPAASSIVVTITFNSAAEHLDNGFYTGTLTFTNLTDHDGDDTRGIELTMGVPAAQVAWNMDENPGWETSGSWAWGQPQGLGGSHGGIDPTAGYTGTTVYGYNLAGDYEALLPERHLTTTAIDCTDYTQVSLRFWRWLGVEQGSYDHAYIRVSNNGTTWTNVWTNSAQVADTAWQVQQFDISALADNQPTVYVRWTMGPTDGSWNFCGWNIDDVEIWALAPVQFFTAGDLNCDYEITFADINPFVMALTDASKYQTDYPECDRNLADINGDGEVSFADINGFVDLITSPD